MLVRLRSLLSAAVLCSALNAGLYAQAAAQPAAQPAGQAAQNWKDRAEYDLHELIRSAADAKKRLELLNQWKEKYPQTDFMKFRLLYLLETYQQLNDAKNGMATAKEIVALDPKEFRALNHIAFFTPALGDTSAEALDTGEKAAKGMLEGIPATFEDSKKPANVTADQWKQARSQSEALAHKTLGWVAMVRKQNDVAEQSLKKSLEVNPGQGDVYYWLANVIAAQRKPERQSEVLFRYARAASYDGAGALPPAGRKEVEGYLMKAYTGYHGSAEGLEELKKIAKTDANPPAGFVIKSKVDLAQEDAAKQEEFIKNNPELALWKTVKDKLVADGQAYFDSDVKGAGLPKLKGKVVSHTPAARPKEIVLAISDETTPEVTLKLDSPLAGKADPGTTLEFEGAVPAEFTKEPFMVTMELEKEKLKGWPAAAAPAKAPAKRPGGAKRRR